MIATCPDCRQKAGYFRRPRGRALPHRQLVCVACADRIDAANRQMNRTADDLVRDRRELLELAAPHVAAVRGLTVDEAQLYAIEHGVQLEVLVVAEAMAREADQLLT